MGKKRPKTVELKIKGKTYKETFTPFQAKDTDIVLADTLLENACDVFRKVEDRKPLKKPGSADQGYVGEVPADVLKKQGKSVKDKIKEDNKNESGKDLEQLTEEAHEKKKKKAKVKKETKKKKEEKK